jgi:thiamine biosynthesis lipoprotein
MSPSAELRRCRPLLGTFVEVCACADSVPRATGALEAAFAAVERVQRRMSFHEPQSDVSCLNRWAAHGPVAVDPWTYRVLEAASGFRDASRGVFDVTVAPELQRWGYLPAAGHAAGAGRPLRDPGAIELLPDRRVRFRRPVRIDLGGIAKGFAVDRAIEALRDAGAVAGRVNAGGDLRVFGASPTTVHVRHPGAPARVLPLAQLTDAALATSATYFARRRWRGRQVSPIVDPRRGGPWLRNTSVSVRAPTCQVADALTKVLAILGARCVGVLRAHAAVGLLVTPSGRIHSTEGAP